MPPTLLWVCKGTRQGTGVCFQGVGSCPKLPQHRAAARRQCCAIFTDQQSHCRIHHHPGSSWQPITLAARPWPTAAGTCGQRAQHPVTSSHNSSPAPASPSTHCALPAPAPAPAPTPAHRQHHQHALLHLCRIGDHLDHARGPSVHLAHPQTVGLGVGCHAQHLSHHQPGALQQQKQQQQAGRQADRQAGRQQEESKRRRAAEG